MFERLRKKFVLTTTLTAGVILLLMGGLVFGSVALRQQVRPPEVPQEMRQKGMENVFEREIAKEQRANLVTLAASLVLVGVAVELLVFLISWFLAEQAVRPVQEAYERQREFIANASHELKTPIAAIRANFEALDAIEEPWSGNIDAELTHASQLVGDLLALARADDVTMTTYKLEKVDLVKILRSKLRPIEARMSGKELKLELPEKLECDSFGADFGQIAEILLDNAAKYAKSWVRVELKKHSLAVVNDGKTIPATKLERVFERFYQVDKTAEGSGLGLAIAKATADKNSWKLAAASEEGETEFRLEW